VRLLDGTFEVCDVICTDVHYLPSFLTGYVEVEDLVRPVIRSGEFDFAIFPSRLHARLLGSFAFQINLDNMMEPNTQLVGRFPHCQTAATRILERSTAPLPRPWAT
jgi:hypothetical protein